VKTYIFLEPHPSGGHATIEITEEQILKYMKKTPEHCKCLTDEQIIETFTVINWAFEKETEKKQ
jgi:glutaredoxin-related protein